MKLYRTRRGALVEDEGKAYLLVGADWDHLLNHDDTAEHLREEMARVAPLTHAARPAASDFLAPIGAQEVWAAGVTYFRSRDARMEEAKSAGGGDFYDRVYHAARPEVFFNATAHRVVGPGGKVAIRKDASWSVAARDLGLLVS